MSCALEATLVPGPTPDLLLWTRPEDETPAGEAAEQVLGPLATAPARLPLAWPAAWSGRGRRRAAGLRVEEVAGVRAPLAAVLAPLARLAVGEGGSGGSASLASWSLAAKLALELVARQRVAPWVEGADGGTTARWRVTPDPGDQPRLERLAAALPPAARACTLGVDGAGRAELLPAAAALRTFLDGVADLLLRAAARLPAGSGDGWSQRVAAALASPGGGLELRPLVDAPLAEALRRWVAPTAGAEGDAARLLLRLTAPEDEAGPWALELAMVAEHDPGVQLDAAAVWSGEPEVAAPGLDHRGLRAALLHELGRAARVWPPLAAKLRGRAPAAVDLSRDEVAALVGEGAALLGAAGVEVRVPAGLTAAGRRRLRTRLAVRTTAGSDTPAGFGLGSVAEARWEAMLDDQTIDTAELERLASLKQPLVHLRGRWVLLDRGELEAVARRVREGTWRLEGGAAVAAALAEEGSLELAAGDPLSRLRALLASPPPEVVEVPGLVGRLRPYQRRGVAWLERLAGAGLGGILADDMGLGKTVQVLAYLLRRRASRPPRRPSLLICPTSVLGSWEREAARFAPELPLYRHYGAERAGSRRALSRAARAGVLCLTSYGLLRRDRALLAGQDWETVVLDEAQAVKNPTSQVARAAFALPAEARFALTGTPVENRLGELWSLFRFALPGLLGPRRRFLTEVAVPVERFRSRPALERLHRLTGPFLLRRSKRDPGVLPDLPLKLVVKAGCPLTTEQATLYRAAVDDAWAGIRTSREIERRGRVLALITTLKQVCNHPEQVLGSGGRLAGRSGKLDRLGDELEEVLAEGEAALVFTQYRTMGELLVRFLAERLAVRAPFLHGGTPRAERERMVARFQAPDGPPGMVFSLRAGGTGLTLTRASHVFHFDRWWNPAVEEQASDRAHRIGQRRTVVVHPMLSRGTLEERIDELLGEKAELAALVVRSGDAFVSELDDERLEALVRLGDDLAGEWP